MVWDGARAGTDCPVHLGDRIVLWQSETSKAFLLGLQIRVLTLTPNSATPQSFLCVFSGVHHYPSVPFLCSTWKLIYSMNYQFYRNDFKFVILSITSLGKLDSNL